MKIILEFGEGEEELARNSYNGPQLHGAGVDFDNYLFRYKKDQELSDTTLAHIDEIHKEFSTLFSGLLYER